METVLLSGVEKIIIKNWPSYGYLLFLRTDLSFSAIFINKRTDSELLPSVLVFFSLKYVVLRWSWLHLVFTTASLTQSADSIFEILNA